MKVLYVGEAWQGSCARSMKEALMRRPGLRIAEANENGWVPRENTLALRVANRLLEPLHATAFRREIDRVLDTFRPDVVMTYKGHSVGVDTLRQMKSRGIRTVNIYPDYSPHAYGEDHQRAVGEYDLVLSTKPFHRALWKTVYGYDNDCEFVPQGYDPLLHLVTTEPGDYHCDVALVGTWRREYGEWMHGLASRAPSTLRVAIGGSGWDQHRAEYPASWSFIGPVSGQAYIEWLRGARICLAPLNRHVVVDGRKQPGDEDTTRTYELAAGKCFFLHQRTGYVANVYDEDSEVPMFDSADELVELITRFLPDEAARRRYAAAAHARAVPAYSLDARAARVLEIIRDRFGLAGNG